MKIKELIELLSKEDPELKVFGYNDIEAYTPYAEKYISITHIRDTELHNSEHYERYEAATGATDFEKEKGFEKVLILY